VKRFYSSIFLFIGIPILLFYLFSCSNISVLSIRNLKYDNNDITQVTETISVDRTKEFSVTVTGNNPTVTWKLDDITFASGQNLTKLKLNDYASKLNLNSAFFNIEHTLSITASDGRKSVSIEKKIKVNNLQPVVIITPEVITEETEEVTVNISDPENDGIISSVKVLKLDGSIIWKNEKDLQVKIPIKSFPRDNYIIDIYVKDIYDAERTVQKMVNIINRPPTVQIVQPFQNEVVPTYFILRWNGIDNDPNDRLKYKVSILKGSNTILTSETTTTEFVVSGLEYNAQYKASVTAYDLSNASSTAEVNFKTNSKPRYSYVISKSFDGKSIINISSTINLPTIKLEGFFVNSDDSELVDLDVVEDYIYTVGGTSLYVIDASDKSQPKLIKKIDLGTTLTSIKIYKHYAIIGEGTRGLTVVDLKDPANPIVASKEFGKIIKRLQVPVSTYSKFGTKTNSKVDITQGKISSIKLSGTNAYLAVSNYGLLKLNLVNIPNITINDVIILYQGQVNDLDIGQFNSKFVIAFSDYKSVKYVNLSDAENAPNELPSSSVTNLANNLFDTEVKGVKLSNNNLYAFTIDRIRKWINDSISSEVAFELGAKFTDMLFIKEDDSNNHAIVLDSGKGLTTYLNDSKNEPNKLYKAFDIKYLNNFVFAVGDGFHCNGLYVLDVRDPLEPTIRRWDTGQFLNKIDVKMKAVPKSNSTRVAKIVVANTESKIAKLYDFDYTTLNLSTATPLDLSGFNSIYDVAIDAQGRAYVLGKKSSGNVVEIFSYDGNSLGVSVTLPATISQNIPYFSSIEENVEPKSLQVVVDYISEAQKPSHVIVSCGQAGIVRYTLLTDNAGNILGFNDERKISTPYYVITESQNGYTLKKYNPGNDLAIAVDKYFDRIFVADGDFNGIWILDRNGVTLTEKDDDNLTKTPVFEGAPARNISWYGEKIFVSGGGFGIKILSSSGEKITDIDFKGLTYAFHTEADNRQMVVGTDNGILLYDITNLPAVKPISTLNLPMYKILGR